MNRLIEYTVRRGFVIAWRLAGSPTSRSPLSVNATTLGVRRLPSWLAITFTSLPSITATTELVVPRSMPMIFSPVLMNCSFQDRCALGRHLSDCLLADWPACLADLDVLPLIG